MITEGNKSRASCITPGPDSIFNRRSDALTKFSSKRDADLAHESKKIQSIYPFAHHKDKIDPISTRVRTNIRSIDDFDSKTKLKDATPDELIIQRENENPYKLNRSVRKTTKKSFASNEKV